MHHAGPLAKRSAPARAGKGSRLLDLREPADQLGRASHLIITMALLIGIATPPMGIGLYIMVEVGKVSFEKVTIAVLPFLIPLILVLTLITYIPPLTLWLPDLIMGPQ